MSRTALITGGSSGLGLAYAELLGMEGYRIIILARNPERISKAVSSLGSKGMDVHGISADVTDLHAMEDAVLKVKTISPALDFLILNAGEVTPRLLTDFQSPLDLKKDIDIDLWGIIHTAWSFVPMLSDGGRVLMTSSGFGLMGAAGYTTYCAAKAGIINFAEALRRELLFRNIGVYVACPGDLNTPQFAGEIASQPPWMKEQSSPRKVLPADQVARKILKKCRGKARMLILPDPSVGLLYLVLKILPASWSRLLLDKMFPKPRY
jgi:3-dehydrosphinganine reductase